nr:probable N-acetyltransferase HLS1 [Ipomoea batatas]
MVPSKNVDYAYMGHRERTMSLRQLFIHKFGYVRFQDPIDPRPPRRPIRPNRRPRPVVENIERNKLLGLGTWVAFFRGGFVGANSGGNPPSRERCQRAGHAQHNAPKLLNHAVPCLKPPSSLQIWSGPFGFLLCVVVWRRDPVSFWVRALLEIAYVIILIVCGHSLIQTTGQQQTTLTIVTEVWMCDDNKHLKELDIQSGTTVVYGGFVVQLKALKDNEQNNSLQELISQNSKGALFVDPREV